MNGHIIDDATPNAQKAVQFIENRMAGSEGGTVTFSRIEATRQQINRFQRAAMKSVSSRSGSSVPTEKSAGGSPRRSPKRGDTSGFVRSTPAGTY